METYPEPPNTIALPGVGHKFQPSVATMSAHDVDLLGQALALLGTHGEPVVESWTGSIHIDRLLVASRSSQAQQVARDQYRRGARPGTVTTTEYRLISPDNPHYSWSYHALKSGDPELVVAVRAAGGERIGVVRSGAVILYPAKHKLVRSSSELMSLESEEEGPHGVVQVWRQVAVIREAGVWRWLTRLGVPVEG